MDKTGQQPKKVIVREKSSMTKLFILLVPLCFILLFRGGVSALEAKITIDIEKTGVPVNRLILGSNVQWIDRGDELLEGTSLQFSRSMLQKVKEIGPTIIRYPGGSLSDLYHWKDGIGGIADRKKNQHFYVKNRWDAILMGTTEFLQLCKILGAEPLITVNVVTGTAEEATKWVEYTNKSRVKGADGTLLPAVKYWEIGNEPYLKDENRGDLAMSPEEFAKRANNFIRNMRRVDSSLKIGIPLRSDRFGGQYATPYQGYNEKVLKGITEPFDFVALHNAYLPFAGDKKYRDEDLYRAAMAGSLVVKDDFAFTRSLLEKFFPNRAIKLAVTEYNAFFSMGGKSTDSYNESFVGALYVADLINLFAQTDDLLMANFWSLTGNGYFGAISNEGRLRPSYAVLKGYNNILRGNYLPLKLESTVFENTAVGFVPGNRNVPTLSVLGTRDKNIIRIVAINKDISNSINTSISFVRQQKISSISYQELNEQDYFNVGRRSRVAEWGKGRTELKQVPFTLALKAHSITIIEIRLRG